MTHGLLFSGVQALFAGPLCNSGERVIRPCLTGTWPWGVSLALCPCIDVRVYLRGETARAATQKPPPREHARMAALFTNTIQAFRTGRHK